MNPESSNQQTYERARLARDNRFDGVFFTGVLSTGIFCRPICPAPSPKRENVRYFKTASAALQAGLRPCLRCKPEAAPDSFAWRQALNTGELLLNAALATIAAGYLQKHSVQALAGKLGVSDRHLRRLFMQHLGTTPLAYARHQQLLFARQLIAGSELTMTEVAMAAGYRSVRQFNTHFLQSCGHNPSRIKRQIKKAGIASSGCRLQLSYKPPYAFQALLDYYRAHKVDGVEETGNDWYARTFRYDQTSGWFKISQLARTNELLIELFVDRYDQLLGITQNLKRMLDMSVRPDQVAAALQEPGVLLRTVSRYPGLRLPGCWDVEEALIRAILGQRVSLTASMKLLQRVVNRYGQPVTELSGASEYGLTQFFPLGEELQTVNAKEQRIGRVQASILEQLRTIPWGKLLLQDELKAYLLTMKGVGSWTVNYTLLRGCSQPDIWLESDAAVKNALKQMTNGEVISNRLWQPWRSYAVLYLWKSLEDSQCNH